MTPSEPNSAANRARWREALRLTTLGWELALPIFGGVLAGYYLDEWLAMRPVFTLGLLMLGLSVSGYTLWQTLQRLEAQENHAGEESGNSAP